MENNLNKLLARQIKRHFGAIDNLPDELKSIFQDINKTYINFEDDVQLLQNSIEISSQELRDAFQKHKHDAETQKETINKIKEAIYTLNPSVRSGINESETAYSDSSHLFDSLIKLIEDHKQTEETLHNERTLFRTIIDLIPDAVYVKDTQGRKILANPKEVQFAGKDKEEEIIGKTDFDLYPDSAATRSLSEDQFVLKSGQPILNADGTLTDRIGQLHWLLVSKVPLYDVHGKITGLVGVTHDITDQKLSEQALRESEVNFRSFFETIDDMIFIANKQGEIFYVNNSVSRKLGYSLVELQGMHILDVHPATKRTEAEQIFDDMFAGKRESCPLPLGKKDGTFVPVETRIWFGKWDGKDCIFGISKDLSKEQESLQKFNKIFDNNPALMAISTLPEKVFTEVNQAFVSKTGYTKDEIVGRTSSDLGLFIQPEKQIEIVNEIEKTGNIHNCELKVKTKQGDILDGLFSGEIIENQEKKYFLTVLVDITKSKKLEEEITLQNSFYNIVSTVSGKLIQADADRLDVEIINAQEALGIFNQVDRSYVFELDPIRDEVSNTFEWCGPGISPEKDNLQGIPFSVYPLWKKTFLDNKHLYIESVGDLPADRHEEKKLFEKQGIKSLLAVPMYYGASLIGFIGFDSVNGKKQWNGQVITLLKIYASILAGVIYKKKTEEILLKAKQEAETANKSKSVFLANMSHEIRTPLNAIIGFSQLMNRDRFLTDSQKEYNHSIIRAGEHLLALINAILELSKVEAGRVELNPTNVDLYALLGDIQMIFKERAQSKHLQCIFETADDLPRFVIVDDSKLRQIFVNLIGNAIKFTDEGGIAVRTRVDIENEVSGKLIVEIQDSGPGIPEDEFNKLFKHFEQTSSGIKKSSGTGLGLTLSRELANLMGGNISVSSEVGKGSVFTFYVQIKEGVSQVIQDVNVKRVLCVENGHEACRILVVDDKEENLQVVVNLLKLVGFETNEAVNGQDAIERFEEWDPHLILMDMRMPVMDGYEATRRIKATEKGQKTPIIALTASSFEEERKRTMALGMHDYIRKPFRESELFNSIGKVLGVKYIYEEEPAPFQQKKYLNNDLEIAEDIAKLPTSLVLQMQAAVAVADFELLIELIHTIDRDNSELAQRLMELANNYDYDYLQKILITSI